MSDKVMPIGFGQGFRSELPGIPWAAIAHHEKQAQSNHDQTLDELRGRGGLAPCEAVAIIEDCRWHEMGLLASIFRLKELVPEWKD